MLNQHRIRNYSYAIPLVYFTAVVLWVYFGSILNTQESEPLVLLFCLPFLSQLWLRNQMLSILLAMLLLVWSVWMLFAFASEYAQIESVSTTANTSLIWLGLSFVLLNFLMAIWMFPAEMGKARQENQYQF